MINRGRCVTLVLLDILSTKHDHRWIWTLWTCSCVSVCAGLVPLTLKLQFSIYINNFELTADPFKLIKLYNAVLLFN